MPVYSKANVDLTKIAGTVRIVSKDRRGYMMVLKLMTNNDS